MTDPVLVEVTRGPIVESRHHGALAIVDAAGRTVLAIGDVARPVFPRSAVKALQALALVESGAADRFAYGPVELALACASHGGEPAHVEAVRKMLAAAGRSEQDLECGPQWPSNRSAADQLVRRGITPGAIYNNCSGKHAGFIAVAAHRGVPVAGYVRRDHPVQREVTSILAAMTGAVLDDRVCGVDGCSIPTYAAPLERLAHGFARFVTGEGLAPDRARAARRLFDACNAEPFMVAGTGRFCTQALTAFRGRLIVKGGAEGFYCAGFPERGLGVAIKCDDGAARGAETVMAQVIDALLSLGEEQRLSFGDRLAPPVLNRVGAVVGVVRMPTAVHDMVQTLRHVAVS